MKTSLKVAFGAILCFSIVGVGSAFKAAKPVKKAAAPVTYIYNLSTSAGARNASNWTLTPGPVSSCGPAGSVPCRVIYDSADYSTLQAYINDQHFTSDDEVASGIGFVSKQ